MTALTRGTALALCAGLLLLVWQLYVRSDQAAALHARFLLACRPARLAHEAAASGLDRALLHSPRPWVWSSGEEDCSYGRLPPLYWTSQQLGVFHYRIPGLMPYGNRSTSLPVVLHLFLKTVSADKQGFKVKGFCFVEAVEGSKFSVPQPVYQPHRKQPDAVGETWQPKIYLSYQEQAGNWSSAPFAVGARNITRNMIDPFAVELTLSPAQAAAASVALLRVDDWLAFFEVSLDHWAAHLRPDLRTHGHIGVPQGVQRGHTAHSDRRCILVLSPMYGLAPGVAAKLLMHSLRYHLKLGLSGFFLYARPRLIGDLLGSAAIRGAIARGHLRLMLWESEFPGYKEIFQEKYADQTLILSHAVLAHNNDNAFLIIADVDEFLVSFTPITPAALLATMSGMLEGAYEARLGRLNALCADCYGTEETPVASEHPELDLWTSVAPAAASRPRAPSVAPAHRRTSPASGKRNGLGLEAALLSAGGGNGSAHPLAHYTLVHAWMGQGADKHEFGKSILDPQHVTVWSVHSGYGTLESRNFWGNNGSMQPLPPLAFLHLQQMFSSRKNWRPWLTPRLWLPRTDWQWALEGLSGTEKKLSAGEQLSVAESSDWVFS